MSSPFSRAMRAALALVRRSSGVDMEIASASSRSSSAASVRIETP